MHDTARLRTLAEQAGLRLGGTPDVAHPAREWLRPELLAAEFDGITSNDFHWCDLQPEGPGEWNWSQADQTVARAEENCLRLRGHSLVWYQKLPQWLLALDDAVEIERRMIEHITAVVGRYRGRVASWDVVNECLWLPDGRADGLRRDHLTNSLGPGFIDAAFHAAREADPDVELVLNEALLNHSGQARNREALLRLIAGLKDRAAPIDAIGIQSHLFWDDLQPLGELDPRETARLIREIDGLGFRSLLTELDVFDAALFGASPPEAKNAERDRMIAEVYESFLDGVLPEPGLDGITFWGFGDASSWFNTYVRRLLPERLPDPQWLSRPLLFDRFYERKPSYFAVARSLERAIALRSEAETSPSAPTAR